MYKFQPHSMPVSFGYEFSEIVPEYVFSFSRLFTVPKWKKIKNK